MVQPPSVAALYPPGIKMLLGFRESHRTLKLRHVLHFTKSQGPEAQGCSEQVG